MAVQVLYFEQIRLRNAMSSSIGPTQFLFNSNCHQFPQRSGSGAGKLSIKQTYVKPLLVTSSDVV